MSEKERSTPPTLPDEETFKSDLVQINRFQEIAKKQMVRGRDFGVVPGTDKPTLLKPGAEKISKLLKLADTYEVIDRQEDWDKPFFRYLVKCQLKVTGTEVVVSEGFGECNSKENRYRWRWVYEGDLPPGIDTSQLVTRRGRYGTQYRVENEDIFTQVNTMLKVAKKRALVDASLSAGRLSDVFTQDIEDFDTSQSGEETETKSVYTHCPVHDVKWIRKGNDLIHKQGDGWCNARQVVYQAIKEKANNNEIDEARTYEWIWNEYGTQLGRLSHEKMLEVYERLDEAPKPSDTGATEEQKIGEGQGRML